MNYKQYAGLLKAFAEPRRLRILHLLYYRQVLSRADLQHILIHKAISRQLQYLHVAGLIQLTPEGLITFYTIHDIHKPLVEAIISRLPDDKILKRDLLKHDQLHYHGKLESKNKKVVSHQ